MTYAEKLRAAKTWLEQQPYAGNVEYWIQQAKDRYNLNQIAVGALRGQFK